jgi:hypothetical protein
MGGSGDAADSLRRWSIQRDEKDALEAFRNRLSVSLFGRPWWESVAKAIEGHYFLFSGANPSSRWGHEEEEERLSASIAEAPPNGLLYYVHCLLRAAYEVQASFKEGLYFDPVFAAVKVALDESPDLGVRLQREGNRAILLPVGAGLLDSRLVNPVLSWLPKDSQAQLHLEAALQERLQGIDHSRQCLDALRKALEETLREVLRNAKSLENQKEELGRWLKERGVHPQVGNMFQTLLAQYAQYQNDAVKHGNAWGEAEVDFVIYLTASFMYLLLDVQRKHKAETSDRPTTDVG